MTSSDNIDKLRKLVDGMSHKVDEKTLNEIERIINQERDIIKKLKKPANKIKHYETICTSILTLIHNI